MISIGIRIVLDFSIPFSTPTIMIKTVAHKNNKNQNKGSIGEVINCSKVVSPISLVAATIFAGIVIYDHKNLSTHPPITA